MARVIRPAVRDARARTHCTAREHSAYVSSFRIRRPAALLPTLVTPSDVLARLTSALADRYRVDRELGAGGMATVYLATDLRHERDVAIKVLHPDLGAMLGADRFLTEIRVTAKLQHPHILPLLDSGSAGGLLYYVMPLVTGETLRARLAREKLLPIADALRIAREVADALQHAHSLGIIHRDIKPENILLQGGYAVVADFGIALALEHAGGERMTQTGLSLGTPQYMSPEQAMGERSIDARSDIYALGAVTYEMLSGDPPFDGNTVQSIIAKVLTERPTALRAIRDTVSAPVEFAVFKALAKLPADRFASARDFASALQAANSGSIEIETGSRPRTTSTRPTIAATLRHPIVLGLATITIASATLAAWTASKPKTSAESASRVRFDVSLPDSIRFEDVYPWTGAISPDGSEFVFAGQIRDNGVHLFRRRMDQTEISMLPAAFTEQNQPMYSPDSKWLAAEDGVNHRLRKLRLDDGTIADICACSSANGGDWGSKNELVLGFEGTHRGLSRVSADGGAPVPLTKIPASDSATTHMYPIFAADGETIVFSIFRYWLNSAELAVTSLRDGTVTPLGVKGVRTLSVMTGRIIYLRADGTMMQVPFDAAARRVTGEATPVPGVAVSAISQNGTSRVAVGRNGGLLRLISSRRGMLGWAKGNDIPTLVSRDRREFSNLPRLSPDGTRIVTALGDIATTQIWVISVATGTTTRLSTARWSSSPSWSRDGRQVYYLTSDGDSLHIVRQSADGGGSAQTMATLEFHSLWPFVSPDGTAAVYRAEHNGNTDVRVIALRDGGGASSRPFVATSANELPSNFSPNGRWVLIRSDESGRDELSLRSFPDPSIRVPLSSDGIEEWPFWSRDGTVLYYINSASQLIALHLTGDSAPSVVRREVVRQNARSVSEDTTDAALIQPGAPAVRFHPSDIAADGRLLGVINPSSQNQLVIEPHWRP